MSKKLNLQTIKDAANIAYDVIGDFLELLEDNNPEHSNDSHIIDWHNQIVELSTYYINGEFNKKFPPEHHIAQEFSPSKSKDFRGDFVTELSKCIAAYRGAMSDDASCEKAEALVTKLDEAIKEQVTALTAAPLHKTPSSYPDVTEDESQFLNALATDTKFEFPNSYLLGDKKSKKSRQTKSVVEQEREKILADLQDTIPGLKQSEYASNDIKKLLDKAHGIVPIHKADLAKYEKTFNEISEEINDERDMDAFEMDGSFVHPYQIKEKILHGASVRLFEERYKSDGRQAKADLIVLTGILSVDSLLNIDWKSDDVKGFLKNAIETNSILDSELIKQQIESYSEKAIFSNSETAAREIADVWRDIGARRKLERPDNKVSDARHEEVEKMVAKLTEAIIKKSNLNTIFEDGDGKQHVLDGDLKLYITTLAQHLVKGDFGAVGDTVTNHKPFKGMREFNDLVAGVLAEEMNEMKQNKGQSKGG